MTESEIRRMMDRAVRRALRGHGGAEPNPMVGCVLVAPDGSVVAEGHHARCGGPHAEAAALAAAGARARGTTAIVTLEPCAHRGRTGPCADALIEAGVARVLYAVADPNPLACGGAERLRAAGIPASLFPHAGADELARPFLKRVATGLPWVLAKWAQSIDGAIALASGESKWISSARSRAMVHRERGRVDAVLTGIGTVLADDPLLTPRGGVRRRTPLRIIYDPNAETPPGARVLHGETREGAEPASGASPSRAPARSASGASDHPAVYTPAHPSAHPPAPAPDHRAILLVDPARDAAAEARLATLRAEGADAVELGADRSIAPALRALAARGVATVLVECGGGLLGKLLAEELVDEAWVFVAPILVGERDAVRAVRGLSPTSVGACPRARLLSVRRRGDDTLLHYRFG
ncbi:MAG: Riboflavin biosynthesis protein RibD [Planctomycetota bacterium]|jgi:diaminohydroxyphosphoribosylaminopyrimidine deaminase/5-amino-6-(5-phosphoribosylamino)uracil reductase